MADVGDQLVVLDPISGHRVLLNASAALIFTAFEGSRAISDVISQLADETGANAETIEPDVLVTVDQLVSQGLLVGPGTTVEVSPVDADEEVVVREDAIVPDTASWAFDSGPRVIGGVTVQARVRQAVAEFECDDLFADFPPSERVDDLHRVDVVASSPDADDGRRSIVVDGIVRHTASDAFAAFASLHDQLDDLLAHHAVGLRFHAGAVEKDGRVVVVLGQSGYGKSTLTAALVQRGFRYLTDEVVIVDEGRVVPYPRPLDLDADSCATLGLGAPDLETTRRKGKVLARRLGDVSPGGRVAMIVLLTGRPADGEAPEATEVPAGEALMAMLPLTFAPTFEDPEALERLAALCRAVAPVRLARASLDEMVGTVEAAFAQAAREERSLG